jgi:hypothetical protein
VITAAALGLRAHNPGIDVLVLSQYVVERYATAMLPVVVAVGSDPVRHRRDAWLEPVGCRGHRVGSSSGLARI